MCPQAELLLTVYEALMGYVVGHGGLSDEASARKLLVLHACHADLLRYLRNPRAARKGRAKKAKAKDKDKDKEEEEGAKAEDGQGKQAGKKTGKAKTELFVHPKHAMSFAVGSLFNALL